MCKQTLSGGGSPVSKRLTHPIQHNVHFQQANSTTTLSVLNRIILLNHPIIAICINFALNVLSKSVLFLIVLLSMKS